MRHRLKHINLANDRHSHAEIGDGRESIVEKTSDKPFKELDSPQQESLRSYRAVYQIARFALDNPSAWLRKRIRRVSVTYGLPVVWGALGCVMGLGLTVVHQQLTPSVMLPSQRDMNAVFAVHDINELLLATQDQIRTK
jgi:hypothetical protein